MNPNRTDRALLNRVSGGRGVGWRVEERWEIAIFGLRNSWTLRKESMEGPLSSFREEKLKVNRV